MDKQKRRSTTLGIRLSRAERAAIERAAAREMRRASDYVRSVVLSHIYKEEEEEKAGK